MSQFKSNYRAGLFNVASYQVSGYPFVTGSTVTAGGADAGEVKVQFPHVTKNVTVINTSTTGLRVYFCASSSANTYRVSGDTGSYPNGAPLSGLHFITLENKKDSITFDIKCREIYVALTSSVAGPNGAFELWAELTGIPSHEMFMFTGSGLTTP